MIQDLHYQTSTGNDVRAHVGSEREPVRALRGKSPVKRLSAAEEWVVIVVKPMVGGCGIDDGDARVVCALRYNRAV